MAQLKAKHRPSAPPELLPDEAELRHAIEAKLAYELGKRPENANDHDWYRATVLAVRDRVVDIWMHSRDEAKQRKKRVYYLSIEFLIGRLLLDTLSNLRLVEPARRIWNGWLGSGR